MAGGKEGCLRTMTRVSESLGGGADGSGSRHVSCISPAPTLRSGGSFSSPDFYLLISLPVTTANRARRGGPRSVPTPAWSGRGGRWRLFLGRPPQHPSRPAPSLTRQQTHLLSGVTSCRSARGPCPHRQLCSQFLLFPSLRPKDQCRLSCSVTTQWGTPTSVGVPFPAVLHPAPAH